MKIKFYLIFLLVHFSMLATAQLPYSIKWQKNFGGSQKDRANDILPLSDSGYLVAGYSFSNDGDVTGHHGSTSTSDGWIVRLNAKKEIVWQKSIGGTGNDHLRSVLKTSDGNFIALGTSSTADYDITNNFGGQDIWVIKFSGDGNIIWSKSYGGSGKDTAGNIVAIPGGGYMITGNSFSTDGQVNAVGSALNCTIWYFRISESGNFLGGHAFPNASGSSGQDIRLLPDGNLLMSVQPELGNEGFTFPENPFQSQAWLIKLKPDGEKIWQKPIVGPTPPSFFNPRRPRSEGALQLTPYGIVLVENGTIGMGMASPDQTLFAMYLNRYDGTTTNLYKQHNDVFSGMIPSRANILSPNGILALPDSNVLITGQRVTYPDSYDDPSDGKAFLARYSFNGPDRPAPLYFGGSNEDGFSAIKRELGSGFVIAGFSSSSDGDLTGNKGMNDFWIVGLNDSAEIKKNLVSGLVYIDHNNNQQFDAGDKLFDQFKVRTTKGTETIEAIPYGGIYNNQTDTGNYVTTVLTNPFYSVQPVSHNSSFSNYGNEDKVNFALTMLPGKRNYSAAIIPLTPARPGEEIQYEVVIQNKGTDTLKNRTVEMVKDSRLTFVDAVPTQSYNSGDTLKWVLNNVYPDSTVKIQLRFNAAIPPDLNHNDTLISSVNVDSVGDLARDDNYFTLHQIVTGSYDPNDKITSTGSSWSKSSYDKGNYLYYTIRFQNTGTDTAFSVTVTDTLSNRFDKSSLEMIAASHPYQLNRIKDNIYIWKFKGILLPDSNRNEPRSHGFVSFRVKPVTGLSVGSVLENSAAIFFDYNLPVITNLHQTTLVIVKPDQPSISGIQSTNCRNAGSLTATLDNFPTATSGTTVTASINGTPVTVNNGSITINTTALNAGENKLEVVYTNTSGTSTAFVKFTIVEPVTPDLTLSATAVNITDQSPPVTITVSAQTGGGSQPLFTFAKDKSFSSIIQGESTTNSITLQPSVFVTGDNKIYVRMKTSATCYSDQYGLDSILIVKSTPTGIIDPEFPNSKISIGPNPFKGSIHIRGLQPIKTYLLKLVNTSGQVIWQGRVKNAAGFVIEGVGFPAGLYWLHLTDEKKQKQLGSFALFH